MAKLVFVEAFAQTIGMREHKTTQLKVTLELREECMYLCFSAGFPVVETLKEVQIAKIIVTAINDPGVELIISELFRELAEVIRVNARMSKIEADDLEFVANESGKLLGKTNRRSTSMDTTPTQKSEAWTMTLGRKLN